MAIYLKHHVTNLSKNNISQFNNLLKRKIMLDFIKQLFGGEKGYENLNDDDFRIKFKETKKKVLLDVRSKAEFDNEKIPNALNYDIRNPSFKDKAKHLDKDKTIFIYCQAGVRSARACRKMKKMGFENLVNLKGGIVKYSGRTV